MRSSRRGDTHGILGAEIGELEDLAASLGEARFRGRQVFEWLHRHGVFCAGEMENIPRRFREKLAGLSHGLPLEIAGSAQSEVDASRKFSLRLEDGHRVEAVLIPEKNRLALCVSTQVGCAMGCLFCRTGRMGFVRDLDTAEIVAQYHAVRGTLQPGETITHIVFMGMGEPLANFGSTLRAIKILTHPLGVGISPRRITVSTVGVVPALGMLLQQIPVHLTVSLNAADEATRRELMPASRRYPLARVLEALKKAPLPPRRRFTIAYVMIKGRNESPSDAEALARLLRPLRCKVNLIPFNPFPSSALEPPPEEAVLRFQNTLRSKGITTHIRHSRGKDILGACGQLGAEPGESLEGERNHDAMAQCPA